MALIKHNSQKVLKPYIFRHQSAIFRRFWTYIPPFEDSLKIACCSETCRSFFVSTQQPSPQWARASSFTRFQGHTQRRTIIGRTPLDEWSALRRDLYLTTLNIYIHAPGGIRTHILSRRAAADLRLRPRGYWDRLRGRYLLWIVLYKVRLLVGVLIASTCSS